jgi:hypothetical protein
MQQNQLKGRVSAGKFEVSYNDEITWERSGKIIEFAWRMQNAGPGKNPFRKGKIGFSDDFSNNFSNASYTDKSGKSPRNQITDNKLSDRDINYLNSLSQDDMRCLSDLAERLTSQQEMRLNSEDLHVLNAFPQDQRASSGATIHISEDDLFNFTKVKFSLEKWPDPYRRASFSLQSNDLPSLSADCGQFASGSSGGNYLVGTVSHLTNDTSQLSYLAPYQFEQTHGLTRDEFIGSTLPSRAQGITFLDVNTRAFHYGKINPDGSISQTDANLFGFFNSELENYQRASMDIITLEDKNTFVTYCDIMYDPAGSGKYFYVYFGGS